MAHTPKNQSEKAILTARRAWCYLVLVLISFLCLFFFYVLIINSTRTHFEIQKGFSLMPGKSIITNFRNVLTDANIPVVSGIRNSLLVSACSAALSVYFSALTAYGIYAYNFKFKKAAFALILLIMTMPTQVSALGFLQLISKMGLKNSFIPLIVPSIAAPTVFFFMKQYLDASLPMEIVEAARIDGAGEFYTFNKIVLPIMKPALAVQAIFSFVASWNNYFIPALVLDTADKKTLPILIAQLRSADFLKFDMGKVYMMVAIAILPVIVVYLLLSKFIDLRRPAGKGLDARFAVHGLILHLDALVALCFSHTLQRKTALLGFVLAGFFQDDRVEQHQIPVLGLHCDDALEHADHVGSHAYTAVGVCGQGLQ